MDVAEAPSSKKTTSSRPSSTLTKYAKKAAGFTDDNSEWLTLKKEVRETSFESAPEDSDGVQPG
jgi:hypothetical protein